MLECLTRICEVVGRYKHNVLQILPIQVCSYAHKIHQVCFVSYMYLLFFKYAQCQKCIKLEACPVKTLSSLL